MINDKSDDSMTNEFLSLFKNGLTYGYVVIVQFLTEEVIGIEEDDVLTQGKPVTKIERVPYHRYFEVKEENYFKSEYLEKDRKERYSDVFFSPFIYSVYKREQKSSLHLTALYVDIDNCMTEQVLPRLNKLPDELQHPTAIIRSGGGVHIYWILQYKHKVSKCLNLWKKTMRKLKDDLGGDPKVIDHARLMRLPGSWNPKSNSKCEFITFNPENRFDLFDVSRALGTYKDRKPSKFHITKKDTKKISRQKVQYKLGNYAQYLKTDLVDLMKYRAKTGVDIGHRNHMLFILKQLMSSDETLDYLNQKVFSEPLPDIEVAYIKNYKAPLSFPKRKNVVEKLEVTPTEQSMFRYLTDEDVYETRKAIKYIKNRKLRSVVGFLLKLLQRKYAKSNVTLKTIAHDLSISTKTASKYRNSRNTKKNYIQVSKSLEVVQQENGEAKKYLPSLEREKHKRPVIEELENLQKLVDKFLTLVEKSKPFQKKQLNAKEYKELLRLIRELKILKDECL